MTHTFPRFCASGHTRGSRVVLGTRKRSGQFLVPTGRVRACQESRDLLCVSNLTEYVTKGQESCLMHFLAKFGARVLHHDHAETTVCGFTSCLRNTDGGCQPADGERIDAQVV